MSANVITTLRERLELEQQIDDLLGLESEQAFLEQAHRIAENNAHVIPVILSNLAEADPRKLNVLGVIASIYPNHQEILNKLYETAADGERTDRERVSAMLILERFLDEDPDPYLLQTLDNPRAVAIESVKDLLAASEREPAVLIDYTRALSEQTIEAVYGVIDTLIEIGQERAVPVLQMLAQVENDAIADAALLTLGRIRHPMAVQGLQSLIPQLAPARRVLGERSLRKLQFSGVPVEPKPAADPAWRALVSPIDGQGQQVVWFIHDPDPSGRCSFVGVALNDRQGIVQAYGNPNVPASALPDRERPGYLHRVPMQLAGMSGEQDPNARSIFYMIESELDFGRRIVGQAQAQSFALDRALPISYRLLGPQIWRYDTATIASSREDPPAPVQTIDLVQQTASLPYHPFFQGWFVGGPDAAEIAGIMSGLIISQDREVSRAWAAKLAERTCNKETLEQIAERLRAMSEWLWRAEQISLVELSTTAANTITEMPPDRHPLIVSMAELGLNIMLHNKGD